MESVRQRWGDHHASSRKQLGFVGLVGVTRSVGALGFPGLVGCLGFGGLVGLVVCTVSGRLGALVVFVALEDLVGLFRLLPLASLVLFVRPLGLLWPVVHVEYPDYQRLLGGFGASGYLCRPTPVRQPRRARKLWAPHGQPRSSAGRPPRGPPARMPRDAQRQGPPAPTLQATAASRQAPRPGPSPRPLPVAMGTSDPQELTGPPQGAEPQVNPRGGGREGRALFKHLGSLHLGESTSLSLRNSPLFFFFFLITP